MSASPARRPGRLLLLPAAAMLAVALLPAGCGTAPQVPPCPYQGEPDFASSAGCLAYVHGRILVVESSHGGVTPPGGKTYPGESAQCAAHRETWEETGLDLMPRQLLHVFDTGFHLYYCEIHAGTGTVVLGPPREVRGWSWLPLEDFDRVKWRFPGQGEQLRRLLSGEE